MDPDEMEEERRLCYVGITRAQRHVYMTRAQTRVLYGEVQMNRPSRFLAEIPANLLEARKKPEARSSLQLQYAKGPDRPSMNKTSPLRQPLVKPKQTAGDSVVAVEWKVGDKASHGKWGVGTVVEVKGNGENQEVKIAFPEQGIKALSVKYAPIKRV